MTFLSKLGNVINRSVLLVVTDLISNSKTSKDALTQCISLLLLYVSRDELCDLLKTVRFCLRHERQVTFPASTTHLPIKMKLAALRIHLASHIIRKKGEAVSVQAMKVYRRSRGIDPLLLNLGTGWR